MIVSLSHQSMVFLLFIALGMVFSAVYDVLRALRRVFKYKSWLVQAQDLVFWIIATLLVFYAILIINYGEVRAYIILGIILGTIIYFSAFSPFVLRVFVRLIKWIKKAVELLIKIILAPFIFIYKLIAKPVKKILKFIKKYAIIIREKLKRAVQNEEKESNATINTDGKRPKKAPKKRKTV